MKFDKLKELFALPPEGPLNGYLVLEIGGNVAGPLAAERLARAGAVVIKLEDRPDPARAYLGKLFTSCNAAKASICFDRSIESEREAYQKLLSLADVIIDNRKKGAQDRDFVVRKSLQAGKRSVVHCSITGYGDGDDRAALDVGVQASSGMQMVNAPAPYKPLKVGFAVIDESTANEAALAITLALHGLVNPVLNISERLAKNHQVVSAKVPLARTADFLLQGQIIKTYLSKQEEFREGNVDNWLAPFASYDTKDGMISLAIATDDVFKKFCEKVLNNPEFAAKYPKNADRLKCKIFETELSLMLKQRTALQWVEACNKLDIVCRKINTIGDRAKALRAEYDRLDGIEQTIEYNSNPDLYVEEGLSIERAADGEHIISTPHTNSLFWRDAKLKPLKGAPKHGEHRMHIEELLEFAKNLRLDSRESFRSVYQEFQDMQAWLSSSAPIVGHQYSRYQQETPSLDHAVEYSSLLQSVPILTSVEPVTEALRRSRL